MWLQKVVRSLLIEGLFRSKPREEIAHIICVIRTTGEQGKEPNAPNDLWGKRLVLPRSTDRRGEVFIEEVSASDVS